MDCCIRRMRHIAEPCQFIPSPCQRRSLLPLISTTWFMNTLPNATCHFCPVPASVILAVSHARDSLSSTTHSDLKKFSGNHVQIEPSSDAYGCLFFETP